MVSFRVAFATAALLASSFALEATRADIRPLKALRRNLKNQIRDNALFQPSTQVRLDYVDGRSL